MPQTVFDLAMAASERPQTQALDHAATRIGVFGINPYPANVEYRVSS